MSIDPPAPQRARILAVDDEALLLNAYRRMLRRYHDVETAAGGREAAAILEQDMRFDIILCDLMMPHFSGMDLYREAQDRFADLVPRFIFMTGGAFTPKARSFLDESGCTWVEKPLDVPALLKIIQEKLR